MTEQSKLQVIEIRGEAYERGCLHGASAAAAIHQNLETYRRLIDFHTGLSGVSARQAALTFTPALEEYAPDLLVEMQGIAAGADCDLADILLINARSELLSVADECTAMAAAPEVSSSGQVLLGQNWDWYVALTADPILLRICQPHKPEILTLVEAGQVGKVGMNSGGLGVCLNFLEHTHQGNGLPIHVILRQMLDCASLGDAVQRALGVPRAGAANLMLAHAEGEILDLELTARDADFFYGDGGWLVHANHFESPRLRGDDLALATSKSTLVRAARARRLLSAAAMRGAVGLDDYRSILADHAHGSYAICRHPEPGEAALQQTTTRASLIMNLSARTLYLAPGQPCTAEYTECAITS